MKLRRELAHQLTKIHASFGGEIKDEPRSVEQLLDSRQLHLESTLPDLHERNAMRFLLTLLPLEAHGHVFRRGLAYYAVRRVLRRLAPRENRRWRRDDCANGTARLRLDDDRVAVYRRRINEQQIVEEKRLGPSDRREPHRHEAALAVAHLRVRGHALVSRHY